MKKIRKIFLLLGISTILTGCSNMIDDLKVHKVLNPVTIEDSEMLNPSNIVKVTVSDDIPENPKPTLIYEYPEGNPIVITGTVTDNGDGTKTITYDLKPINSKRRGGKLPVTINVPGYKPTKTDVDYIPPVIITAELDGYPYEEGEDIPVGENDDGTLEKPEIITNYDDEKIEIEEKYYEEDGTTEIPDLDGDGVDWDDVKKYLEDDANKDKKVKVKVTATPNPDTDPSSKKTSTFKIVKTEKKKLDIVGQEMKNPGNTVIITVEDDIPEEPKPILIYKLPDGSEKKVNGTVTDDGEDEETGKKKKKITFDLNPIDDEVPGGQLPVIIKVPGKDSEDPSDPDNTSYRPTGTKVNYIPPVTTTVEIDGKDYTDGDEIQIDDDDDIDLIKKPVVKTNYDDDAIDITETYLDENGKPIGDLNQDGKVDWEDVKKYLKEPKNKNKKVVIKVKAVPNPDTDPSNGKETVIKIGTTEKPKLPITVIPDDEEPGHEGEGTEKNPKMLNPDNVIVVKLDDGTDVPEKPKPIITYKLPDGTEKEVEGDVVEYEEEDDDGNKKRKKKIEFHLDPMDDRVPGGQLPVVIKVPGYQDEKRDVDYIPPVVIKVETDGGIYNEGDDVQVFEDDDGRISKPRIITNYTDDAINIIEKYYEEDGTTEIPDLDGDGVHDWDDVQKYLKDSENTDKKVLIQVEATPSPDTTPSSKKTSVFPVIKTDKPMLTITGKEMKVPENIITIEVDDDIPESPKPYISYYLPDGGEVIIKGEVVEYEEEDDDGNKKKKKKIEFDLNPLSTEIPGGIIPVVIKVPGYRPTGTGVNYIPDVITKVEIDGKDYVDGSEVVLNDDDIDDTKPPIIKTNYEDGKIDIEETYKDKDGKRIEDQDGDGDVDWNDVKKFIDSDPENPDNKKVIVTIKTTPKPDSTPSKGKETVITVKKTEDPKLPITGKPEMKHPENIIIVDVDDDDLPVDITPKPTIIITLPDGTEEKVEGKVEEYEEEDDDGKTRRRKRLVFDPNPLSTEIPGGVLPVVITVPGYQPTGTDVDHKPPVEIIVEHDGKRYEDGDEIEVFEDDDGEIGKPRIDTNYDEEYIDEKEDYVDEDGKPIEDEDGDGDVDWEDLKKWLKKPEHKGKKPRVIITVKPNPDTEPSSEKSATFTISCKVAVAIDITFETTVYTLTAIKEDNYVTYTVNTTISNPVFIWSIDGVEQSGNSETLIVDMDTLSVGTHTIEVLSMHNGMPCSANATLTVTRTE